MDIEQSIESLQPLNGVLSPDQGAQLLASMFGGAGADTDVDTQPEGEGEAESTANGQEPEGAPEQPSDPKSEVKDDGAPVAPAGEEPDNLSEENAVVLGKNGKYTIAYSKLEEARNEAKQTRQQLGEVTRLAEDLQRKLDALNQQGQARADAGQAPTKVDNMAAAAQAAINQGVNPDIFGDFSPEAMAKGVALLVAQHVGSIKQDLTAEVKQALQPVLQHQQASEATSHQAAILQAHPDAASVAESVELKAWINSKPSYARDAINQVVQGGSAAQVIELLNDFKAETKTTEPKPDAGAAKLTPDAIKAKAQEAATAAVTPKAPTSLSDIPGGVANGLTAEEAFENKSAMGMVDALLGKSPDEIQKFLARVV